MAWVDSYTGWSNNYRVGVGYNIVTPYDPATNKTVIQVRLIADANTGQWFSGWNCSGYLRAYNATGTDTQIYSWSVSATQYAFPSAGSSITVKTSGNIDVIHDKNGVGTFYVTGRFGMDSQTPTYAMPVLTKTTAVIGSGDGLITPTTPTTFTVTQGSVDLVANTREFSFSASGSTVVAGIDGSAAISYGYEYSANDGATWNSITGTSFTGVATQRYNFRTYATAEGTSGYKTTGLYYGYPATLSSVATQRTGPDATISWSFPDTASSGASVDIFYTSVSGDNGSTWSSDVSNGSSTAKTYTGLTPGATYKFRVRSYANTTGLTSAWKESSSLYVPALPTAPSISSLSKNVRKVTINFTKSTFDAQSSGRLHYIEAQYYTGSAWTSWTVLGSVDSTVGTFTTADLLIAKSYRFRVRGYSDTGYGSYSSTSSEIFISAYGYRFESVNGTPTAKAIELAARYTGDVNDTIIVGGVTKTGWKQIQSVKRYTQSGYIDLIQ